MYRKAVIFGLKGKKLTNEEISFLKKNKPWGIILFSRNIYDLFQLKKLIDDIRKTFKDKNYPILIDQEGGNVSRLNKIFNLSKFSQSYFGRLYEKDKNNFKYFYKLYINKISQIFNYVGININTVPVLDIRNKKTHNIIKNRTFSQNRKIVSKIGNICIQLYRENKIATVMKHIPGHGLSVHDSHLKLPIIKASKKTLIKNDFKTFKDCNSFFAMTAHIVYQSYDKLNPATHSKIVIKDVIRKNIGFKGLLISDDISMKALTKDLSYNAIKAIDSGCNLVMHCNGNLREMNKIVKVIPTIDNFTRKKTAQFYNFLG